MNLKQKQIKDELRKAIPPHKTDLSDGPWDGPKARANLKNDGGESYYHKAFAWADPEGDPGVKATYKFIHHEVSADGTIGAANIKGCQSSIAVLNGARGGTTIPGQDRSGVYAHAAGHLKDGDIEPPELKKLCLALEERHLDAEDSRLRILEGETPGNIPVERPDTGLKMVNETRAMNLNIEIPTDVFKEAEIIS